MLLKNINFLKNKLLLWTSKSISFDKNTQSDADQPINTNSTRPGSSNHSLQLYYLTAVYSGKPLQDE